MAVAGTHLTTAGDTTLASSFTTASITPIADALVLMWVANAKAASPLDPTTVTGCSLTWVKIAGRTFATSGTPTRNISLWRAQGSAPTSGAVTLGFNSLNQINVMWSISYFTGTVVDNPNNGAAAIAQSATNFDDTTTATSLTTTLAAIASGNAVAAGVGVDTNSNPAAAGSYTLLGTGNSLTPNIALGSEWIAAGTTTPQMTFTAGFTSAGIAAEIRAAGLLPQQERSQRSLQAVNRASVF